MHSQAWTSSSIHSHEADLGKRIRPYLPLKDAVLKEAHARGLGFRTRAAQIAALDASGELQQREFDNQEFAERAEELAETPGTAEAIGAILDDFGLEISVVKRSDQRKRQEQYSDTAYDVEVVVTRGGIPATKLESAFQLPQFGLMDAGPYRVDSAHEWRRGSERYRLNLSGKGEPPRVAKLLRGRWSGAFYVYAHEHQTDDARCIKSLKAALARAILPEVSMQPRCSIVRPENYQLGAWRVEMRLPASVQIFLNGSPLQFDIPDLSMRHIRVETAEHRFGPFSGRFVDGAWSADLYSNGIEEAKNPTSIREVRRALVHRVVETALEAGHQGENMTFVHSEAGAVVGTVQYRQGRYEAWSRVRAVGRPGNSHHFVGRFESVEEAISQIRASL